MERPRTLGAALTSRKKFIKVIRSDSNASQTSQSSRQNSMSSESSTQSIQQTKSLLQALDNGKKENLVLQANIKMHEDKYKILLEKYNQLQKEHTDLKTNYSTLMSCYNKRDGTLNFQAGRLLVKLLNRPSKDELQKKNIYKNESVFNTELIVVEKSKVFPNVPKIVVECVDLIDKNTNFMTTVGIYRVSGSYLVIQNLRYDVNSNTYKNLKNQKDPHTIIGVLKLFLRELVTPLISLKHMNEHLSDQKQFDDDDIGTKIKTLRSLVYALPSINRDTLNYLIKHLVKVAAIEQNEMNAQSISFVISKCIFFESEDQISLENFRDINALPSMCVQLMIENYYEIFGNIEMVDEINV